MKSKYIKIFMIFAVVFAMVAGLFVTPALANAEEQSLTATVQYDVDSITQSIPDTAIISFPVPYQSVYGNEIDWSVQEGQDVITYDLEAHWMVVNRPTDADATVKLYLIINDETVKEFPVTVPKGQTFVPSYEIKYNFEFEEQVKTSYNLGEASFDLPTPVKEGFTFGGWYETDENNTFTRVLVGTMRPLDLKAKWTANEYTITFETNGGSEVAAITQDYGTTITAPADPTKTGYTFAGWDLDDDDNVDEFPTQMPAQDLTAKAIWTINEYTITFNTDGGSEVAAITQNYGTAVTAPSNPEKTGYTFAGWDKQIPATMPAENITITAQWTINEYTITFNTDGGSEVAAITQNYGTAITAPAAPTKPGYIFKGWDTTIPATMPAGDMTITAQWTINTGIEIKFVVDGNTYHTITGEYGADVTAPADPTKTGYTFAGWDTTIPDTMPAESLTITAQWTVNQYTISFNTDGGSEIAAITQDYGTAITAPLAPTKTGYTFAGWDTTIPATMPAGDMTITAQWTINQYTITFDTVGGSTVAAITQNYGTAVTAPSNPEKTGYTFAGWDTTIPATMPAENMTITAQWTINEYTITFNTDGGSEVAAITQNYGTAVTAPSNPEKTGYTFAGWDKQIPATMPAGDMTITAQWTINEYTITFNTDGGSEVSAITQNYGTAITAPAAPTKPGYIFKGWDTTIPETMPAEDITIKATWEKSDMLKLAEADRDALQTYYADSLSDVLTSALSDKLLTEGTVNGSAITWSSTNSAVSVAEDGTMTLVRPEGSNATVTLYAGVAFTDVDNPEQVYYVYAVFTFEVEQLYSDNSGNVTVEQMEEKYTLTATELPYETNDQANFVLKDNESFISAYDIMFNNGEVTSFDNGVLVRIKLDQQYSQDELVVYHIDDESNYEQISNIEVVQIDGSWYVEFTATEFSPYLVVKTHEHNYVEGECTICGTADPDYDPEPQEITIAEALDIIENLGDGGKTTVEYIIQGTIVEVSNTKYGNVIISENDYSILIYGLYTEDGIRYDSMEIKPTVGDSITVRGILCKYYNNTTQITTPEVEKGYLIDYKLHECDLVNVPGFAASCTEVGKTDGQMCSICGNVTIEQTEIPATGHKDDNADSICDTCGSQIVEESEDLFVKLTNVNQLYDGVQFTLSYENDGEIKALLGIYNSSSYFSKADTTELSQANLLTIEKTENGFAIKTSDNKYLVWNSGNSVALNDTASQTWSFELNENGEVLIINSKDPNRILQYNATSPRFACYTSSQQKPYIYIKNTDVATCTHSNMVAVEAKDPTCTESGNTAGYICNECGYYDYEVIPANGHTEIILEAVEPTCVDTGLTEGKQCSVCKVIYESQEIIATIEHSYDGNGICTVCEQQKPTEGEIETLATFEFGDNGTASHKDGSDLGTSKSYTSGNYTLALTSMSKVYGSAYDAHGNSCIKLGTSSAVGSFSFTVPENVTEVIIYVAKYKSNTSKVSVNGAAHTLTKNSNDGAYDVITVDTSTNKTITFTTVSGGVRCMINTIVFKGNQ